jgi:hypothetical protein
MNGFAQCLVFQEIPLLEVAGAGQARRAFALFAPQCFPPELGLREFARWCTRENGSALQLFVLAKGNKNLRFEWTPGLPAQLACCLSAAAGQTAQALAPHFFARAEKEKGPNCPATVSPRNNIPHKKWFASTIWWLVRTMNCSGFRWQGFLDRQATICANVGLLED